METGRHLRNVRKFLPDYTVSYAGTLPSLSELFFVRQVASIYGISKTLRSAPEQIWTARSMTTYQTARNAVQVLVFTLQLFSLPNYFSFFPLFFEITYEFLKRFLIYYFKALSFIHTSSCTFSYNYVSVF